MQRTGASWYVAYRDGTEEWQYNTASPAYNHAAGEVPYRAIDWSRVDRVVLSSGEVERVFHVTPPPDGYRISLHSRHFLTPDGRATLCFLLVVSSTDAPTPAAGAVSVVYWFPDDTTHTCPHYNCPDVARYGSQSVGGRPHRLVPEHGCCMLGIDTHLT